MEVNPKAVTQSHIKLYLPTASPLHWRSRYTSYRRNGSI